MPHIECVKNNGKPYLRLAESRYVKDIGKQKKFIIKILVPFLNMMMANPIFWKDLEKNLKMVKLILTE